MAYQPNIPAATDQFSKSQGDIQGDFQAIQILIDVNHVDFGSADQGKHKWVTLPLQAASPPVGAFSAGEVGIYNFLNPTTAANELYVHTNQSGAAVIAEVPLTASNQAQTGWCYLPSGLILKWTDVSFAFTTVIAINGPLLGPDFTNVFQVFLTGNNTSTTTFSWNRPVALPNLTINTGTTGVKLVSVLIIGN